MAYDVSIDRVPGDAVAAQQPAAKKHRLLRRLFVGMLMSRQRRADMEIARYLETSGRLTDSVEREIERRMLGNPSGEPW